MVVFRMYGTFFVFLKCTIQGGPKVDLLLIAYLHLWLKFWEGIDKYWIVPVRKLFYFHHCIQKKVFCALTVLHTNNFLKLFFWITMIQQTTTARTFLLQHVELIRCNFHALEWIMTSKKATYGIIWWCHNRLYLHGVFKPCPGKIYARNAPGNHRFHVTWN